MKLLFLRICSGLNLELRTLPPYIQGVIWLYLSGHGDPDLFSFMFMTQVIIDYSYIYFFQEGLREIVI